MIPFLLIAALIIIAVRYFKCRKAGVFSVKHELLFIVFYLYLTALTLKTVIPAEWLTFRFTEGGYILPKSEYFFNDPYNAYYYLGICLKWKIWFRLFDIYIINFILLTPFGFMFPILYPKHKHKTVFNGFLISCLIEIIQLFLPRITDTFDIFLNTISVINGYALYLLFKKAYKRIKKHRKE